MTHLHISVPAITPGTLAHTHELKTRLCSEIEASGEYNDYKIQRTFKSSIVIKCLVKSSVDKTLYF